MHRMVTIQKRNSGSSIALSADQGGTGANYTNKLFRSTAAATIPASGAVPPLTALIYLKFFCYT